MDQEKSFLVLKEMFPETKEEVLKLAYDCSNSLEEAVSFLADRSSSPELESKSSHMSLELLIEELRGKMSDAFDRKKLRVDEEDLVADAVAFYKRPDFDPKAGVRVVYSGHQPLIPVVFLVMPFQISCIGYLRFIFQERAERFPSTTLIF